jgi:hypothetical protein
MKKETIDKIVKHLNNIKSAGITISKYQELNNLNSRFIYNKISEVKNSKTISNEDRYKILNLYDEVKADKPETKDLEQTDNRSEVTLERDENGHISNYLFTIYVRDSEPVIGKFSRDEMALIYRLYSSYGSSLTQREVSRFFPEYSLYDFKRILRTFNITKASSPFPQHIIEENSKEQLLDMQFREKENDFLRTYEAEKVKQLDSQIKKYMKENADLKDYREVLKEAVSSLEIDYVKNITEHEKGVYNLYVYLSDIHVGASSSNQYSLYDNVYNKEEINKRLRKVADFVISKHKELTLNRVIICNLGDSLDSYNGKTSRGTEVESALNNKDQVKTYLEVMSKFFRTLIQYVTAEIEYYCVGESNHGADFDYTANYALSLILDNMDIKSYISNKSIEYFTMDGLTTIYTHGNDNNNMFKGMPLTLNEKTENYINQFLDYNNLSGQIVFVKGDLHQSATTYGKRFKYKSVGSLYGSSNWIMANFGNTRPGCDYSIHELDTNNLMDGVITF